MVEDAEESGRDGRKRKESVSSKSKPHQSESSSLTTPLTLRPCQSESSSSTLHNHTRKRSNDQRMYSHQNHQNVEQTKEIGNEKLYSQHLSWRQRLKHTSWAWFVVCMATGGISNVLHTVPFRARWIEILGLCFFFLNIVMYIMIWGMILTRFWNYPSTFRTSLVHPTESLFVPAFLVSFGTICITIVEYGANNAGNWLTEAVFVIYWINVILSFILSIAIYMILWSSLTFTIAQMTPIWIFPAYPLLIIGPHAANLSGKLPNAGHALQVIVAGFTAQGIGFLVSITIYSAFVYRLMTQKLPADPSRPGMFVSVGPAAFTCSGTIGMASNLQKALVRNTGTSPATFMDLPADLAVKVLRLIANFVGLWFWGLALWFFFVSLVSNIAPLYTLRRKSTEAKRHRHDDHEIRPHKISFGMAWYSYIFPQTALITATFRIADAFNIYSLQVIGCVMTGLLIAMWCFVMFMMVRAVILKQLLWPDKGEDKEEGGFINSTPSSEADHKYDPEGQTSGRERDSRLPSSPSTSRR